MYFFVYAYLYNTSAHLYFKYSSLFGYYYSLGSNERESLLLNLKCILLIYKRDSLNDPVIIQFALTRIFGLSFHIRLL